MTSVSTTASARDDRAAVDKAVSLLSSFGEEARTGVGVSELARRSGLSKSTAFRVLGMLERNGVVERSGTGYRLGTRLHDLGGNVYAPGHEQIRDVLTPYLTDLYEATRETVNLAVLHGTEVLYLAKLYGHRRHPVPSRIGGRLPAHSTASGKLLLAYDPDAAAETMSGPLQAFTPRTLADPAALAAELAVIRRQGIAFDHGEARSELRCVAAPVMGPGGRPVAAISVAGATDLANLRRHEPLLRRLAAAAAQELARARRATPLPRHHALAG